jgi:hypothetical protein
MTIKKEAYDNEREALLVQGAMATEAGKASERGSASTAGRVYAAQQQGQAQVRTAMGDELTNVENSIIEEDSRLRDLGVALDLEEVAGNQLKAANAEAAADKSQSEAISGVISVAQQAATFAPLYSGGGKKNTTAQRSAIGGMEQQYSKGGTMPNDNSLSSGLGSPVSLGENGGNSNWGSIGSNPSVSSPNQRGMYPMNVSQPIPIGTDFAKIGNMNNPQFKKWRKGLSTQEYNNIFMNPQYIEGYNNAMNPYGR